MPAVLTHFGALTLRSSSPPPAPLRTGRVLRFNKRSKWGFLIDCEDVSPQPEEIFVNQWSLLVAGSLKETLYEGAWVHFRVSKRLVKGCARTDCIIEFDPPLPFCGSVLCRAHARHRMRSVMKLHATDVSPTADPSEPQ